MNLWSNVRYVGIGPADAHRHSDRWGISCLPFHHQEGHEVQKVDHEVTKATMTFHLGPFQSSRVIDGGALGHDVLVPCCCCHDPSPLHGDQCSFCVEKFRPCDQDSVVCVCEGHSSGPYCRADT